MQNIEPIETNQPFNRVSNEQTSPSPDNPPWGSWAALGVWIASIVILVLFQNLFVAPYILSQNLPMNDAEQLMSFAKSDPMAVLLTFLSVFPSHVLTLALAWFVITKNRRYSFREMLGWQWGGFRIYHAVLITVLFYIAALVSIAYFGDIENDFDVMLKSSWYIKYVVAVFAVFTAPIVEEVVYRGILYSAFQRTFGKVIAVLAITGLFAGVHAAQYSQNATPDYSVMTVLLTLSLLLTMVRVWTGNLLPCIVLHTVFNAFQSSLMIAEPFLRPYIENAEQTVGLIAK